MRSAGVLVLNRITVGGAAIGITPNWIKKEGKVAASRRLETNLEVFSELTYLKSYIVNILITVSDYRQLANIRRIIFHDGATGYEGDV